MSFQPTMRWGNMEGSATSGNHAPPPFLRRLMPSIYRSRGRSESSYSLDTTYHSSLETEYSFAFARAYECWFRLVAVCPCAPSSLVSPNSIYLNLCSGICCEIVSLQFSICKPRLPAPSLFVWLMGFIHALDHESFNLPNASQISTSIPLALWYHRRY